MNCKVLVTMILLVLFSVQEVQNLLNFAVWTGMFGKSK